LLVPHGLFDPFFGERALSVQHDKGALFQKCETLAPREKAVLRGVGLRKRAKEIGRDLNISEHTVRGYVYTARQKLGLSSNSETVAVFLEYERLLYTHQNRGEQIQWVSEHHIDEAVQLGGFSIPSNMDHGSAADVSAFAGGNPTYAMEAGRPYGGFIAVYDWLAKLSIARWLGLTLLLTVGVILAFSLAATTVLGAFEILHQIGGQHR